MPKKTKRQKLLAELHRKISILPTTPNSISVKSQIYAAHSDTSLHILPDMKFANNAVAKPKIVQSYSDYSYITSDLLRITIFTIIAFILQGVLYFQLHRG